MSISHNELDVLIKERALSKGFKQTQRFINFGDAAIRSRFVKGTSRNEKVLYVGIGHDGELMDVRGIVANRVKVQDNSLEAALEFIQG